MLARRRARGVIVEPIINQDLLDMVFFLGSDNGDLILRLAEEVDLFKTEVVSVMPIEQESELH